MAIPTAVRELLTKRDGSVRVALVGASNDPSKYGNVILKDLTRKGFDVLPVNPREKEIAFRSVYASINDAPGPIHIVNLVVPPRVARAVLEQADPERVPVVWFQPGSFDDEAVAYAREKFETVIAGDCIMVAT
jgi:predicted CoA-binding protein